MHTESTNKNFMRIILIVFLVFFTYFSNAQDSAYSEDYSGENDIRRNIVSNGVWIKNKDLLTDIKGSLYLYDSWLNNAKLYIDKKVYNIMSFNFNVMNQRFEAKFSEDSVLIMNTGNIDRIVIRDKIFDKFDLEDNTSNPFFEVIGRFDKSILLKKYNLFIKEGSLNPMTQKMIRPSQYIINEIYFVSNLDGTNVNEIKLKKSTILDLFDKNKQDKVKEYADENHLNFKEEKDVQRIFLYTNSL